MSRLPTGLWVPFALCAALATWDAGATARADSWTLEVLGGGAYNFDSTLRISQQGHEVEALRSGIDGAFEMLQRLEPGVPRQKLDAGHDRVCPGLARRLRRAGEREQRGEQQDGEHGRATPRHGC